MDNSDDLIKEVCQEEGIKLPSLVDRETALLVSTMVRNKQMIRAYGGIDLIMSLCIGMEQQKLFSQYSTDLFMLTPYGIVPFYNCLN